MADAIVALTPRERAPIDRLLAALIVREVDRATWIGLRADPVVAFFEIGDASFREWIQAEPTDERLEALAEEFARLFLLPGGVPPYATAWLDGDRDRRSEELSGCVQRAFDRLGHAPIEAEPWGRLPFDHLALVLELVATASESERTVESGASMGAALRRQLLEPWVDRFATALQARADSPLYRMVGAMLTALNDAEPRA